MATGGRQSLAPACLQQPTVEWRSMEGTVVDVGLLYYCSHGISPHGARNLSWIVENRTNEVSSWLTTFSEFGPLVT